MIKDRFDKILIFRNLALGNAIVALPVIRALRHSFPRSRIHTVCDSVTATLYRGCPDVDRVILYDKCGEQRGMINFMMLVKKLRVEGYDLSIHLKRFLRNEILAFLSGIRLRVGFKTGSQFTLLNRTIPYREDVNIVNLNMELLKVLNVSSAGRDFNISTGREIQERISVFIREKGLSNGYAAVHSWGLTAGAGLWPLRNYLSLAEMIFNRTRMKSLFLGSMEELERFRKVLDDGKEFCVLPFFQGRTPGVLESWELIKRAKLFVGGNSGPAHMADFLKVKGVVIFSCKDTEHEVKKWGPVNQRLVIKHPRTSCEICQEKCRGFDKLDKCMDTIGVKEVLEALMEV